MTSQRRMKIKYTLFKFRYFISALLILPVSFFVYDRLHRHSLTDKEYFYIYWLFDELYKSIDTRRLELYNNGPCEGVLFIDGRFIIVVWTENANYGDMKFSIYKKDPGEQIALSTHGAHDLPPFYIACKMRAFFKKLKKANIYPESPDYEIKTCRIKEPETLTEELLKEILEAKILEAL